MVDPAGKQFAIGYAGRDLPEEGQFGKNNPDLQDVKGIGPLPRGRYTMGEPVNDKKLGPFCIPLTPHEDNEMFGRSSFYIHGDSAQHPGQASHGCICVGRIVRTKMWESGDKEVEVTE